MKNKLYKLNTLQLKTIATFLMLIDHIAYTLIPQSETIYWIMRIVGRIAAPLFWFCFVEGYRYTRDRVKYIARLAVASAVMMLGNSTIHTIVGHSFDVGLMQPNMFMTMLLMAIIIEFVESAIQLLKDRNQFEGLICALISISLGIAVGLYAEYGWIALFSISILYFIKNKPLRYIAFACINLILCIWQSSFVQVFMIASIPLMLLYNNEKPKRSAKWFFYVFYPTHLWALMIMATFIGHNS